MDVIVNSRAWMKKADLTEDQIKFLKQHLTIYPKEYRPNELEDPKKLELFVETPTSIAIPRSYFESRKKPHHNVIYDLSDGDQKVFTKYPISFKGDLRPVQKPAVDQILKEFNEGKLGGLLSAMTGLGKCLHGDSFIIDAVSGKKIKISELENKQIQVQSHNENGSFSYETAAKIWKSGSKKCYKLELDSGVKLTASYDHPILTDDGYKPISELKKEGFIATPRHILEPLSPLKISDEEVILAGALIADGALNNCTPKYNKGDPKLVSFIKSIAPKIPGFERFGREIYERGNHEVSICGIYSWIRDLELDCLSKNKRVPSRFFGLDNRQLGLFLKWIFTDGNINPSNIELTLASEGLIEDIQFLLKRFGILSRFSYKKSKIKKKDGTFDEYDAWRLIVSDLPNIEKFVKYIGEIPGKAIAWAKCLKYIDKIKNGKTKFNTNKDIVPINKEIFTKIKTTCKKGMRFHYEWGTGKYMSRDRFIDMCDKLNYEGSYKYFAEADIYWDRVKSITELDIEDVYDLTVPITHNAVVNGIVVHNTVMSCKIISELKKPTLVLVHKEFLMEQWKNEIHKFIPHARVGKVQQDVIDYKDKHIVIGMIQSIVNKDYPPDFYNNFGMIVIDEVHHLGSETWSELLPKFKARFRLGVSATIRRSDGAENAIFYTIGPILAKVETLPMIPKIRRVWTDFHLVKTSKFNPALISDTIIMRFLCANVSRNEKVIEQIIQALEAGRKILVTSGRVKHLKILQALFETVWKRKFPEKPIPDNGFCIGGTTEEELRKVSQGRLLWGTTQYVSEAFNVPALDTLVLATPVSDVEQLVGRITRVHEGKKDPVIVDFRDEQVSWCHNLAEKRDAIYDRLCKSGENKENKNV